VKKIETKSAVLLKHHLKALKLPTISAECEKVALRSAKENVDHLGFLLHVLVLDELGDVPASKVGAELLFDVISTAYKRSSVIVTTNLPFEEWKEVLGSERLTGATLDRLTHRCSIVETGRESYRLRDARRRRGEVTDPADVAVDVASTEE
jgi:DNA replication protein DnaC